MSKPRKEIINDIIGAGHNYVSKASEADYLVAANPNSSSVKTKDARRLRKQIITEKELYDVLFGKSNSPNQILYKEYLVQVCEAIDKMDTRKLFELHNEIKKLL